MKITEELISQRIDKYVEENKDGILADIDKRVEKAISAVIKEYFNGVRWRGTDVAKYIEGKVSDLAMESAASIDIDMEEISRLVNKKVKAKVKNISVNFD